LISISKTPQAGIWFTEEERSASSDQLSALSNQSSWRPEPAGVRWRFKLKGGKAKVVP
jgi:hypothetical protein